MIRISINRSVKGLAVCAPFMLLVWLVCIQTVGNAQDSKEAKRELMLRYDVLGRNVTYQKPDSAEFYFNNALKLALEMEEWSNAQKVYSNLALVFETTGRFDTAFQVIEMAESLFSLAEDSVQYGPLSMVKGNLLGRMGQYDSALVHFDNALNFYLRTNHLERASGAANNRATVYQSMGYYNLAAESVFQAMDYKRQSGVETPDPIIWNTLGNIYRSQAEYRKALAAYLKSYRICVEDSIVMGVGITASNLANAYLSLKEPDSALFYSLIGKKYTKASRDLSNFAHSVESEAQAQAALGNFEKGRQLIQKTFDSIGADLPLRAYADLLASLLEMKMEDSAVSDEQISNTVKEYKSLGVENLPITYQRDYHRLTGSYYEQVGRYKEALNAFKTYRLLHDSIWNLEKSNRISELGIQFESLRKDEALTALRHDQLLSEIEIENQRRLLIGTASGGLLLIGLSAVGFFLYRQRQRNQALSESIAARDYERNRLSRELHDGVANELYGIQMAIDGDQETGSAESLKRELSRIRDEVRHISHDLAMPDIRHTSLPEMAEYLVNRWQHVGPKVKIDIRPEGNGDWKLKPEKALHLYRILQEGLTNALRYSREDGDVTILLERTDSLVLLNITNHFIKTLVGENKPGIGLKNLQERAELIGGSATVDLHGGHAHLTVKIPL